MAPTAAVAKRPATTEAAKPAAAKPAAEPVKAAAAPKAAPVAKKAAEPAAVAKPAPAAEPVVAAEGGDAPTESAIEKLTAKMAALTAGLKEAQALLKALAKEHAQLVKLREKVEKKKSAARSSPSGFAKPSKVSDELTDFMGLAKGTMVSRTDITRFITGYVRTNNLNDPADRRTINPDPKLKKLFKLGANDKISYFQLQRLITPFIIKA